MTDLADEDAPDAEDFVSCWLQPLLRAGVERRTSDAWPFALVQRVSGLDTPETGLDDPVIQIDVLHKVVTGSDPVSVVGKRWANEVHRRITLLGLTYPDVTMSDGSTAGIDYLTVLIRPHRQPFGDETVARFVARYKLGLSYVAV
jgi:hypothetical protein